MITMTMFLMSLATCYLLETENPLKMSMILLATSTIMFLATYTWTSALWFPMIMYLVFMGGILMLFMILSSIMPNEKTEKNLKKVWCMIIFFLAYYRDPSTNLISSSNTGVKSLLSSPMTMFFFLTAITCYFTVVILMIKKNKTPLRAML